MTDLKNENSFPIPLSVGWGINIAGWVLFATTMNTAIELITAILCIGCVYVGYKHKDTETPPAFGNENLTAQNLIYASAFEAVWMLTWATGLFY